MWFLSCTVLCAYSACNHVRTRLCTCAYMYVHMCAHLCTVCVQLATAVCNWCTQQSVFIVGTNRCPNNVCSYVNIYIVDLFISWDTVWLVSFVGWICSTYRLTSLTRHEIPNWIHDHWVYSMNERCVRVIAWLPWRKLIKYKNLIEYIRLHAKELNRVEYNRIELKKYLTNSRTHCGKWSEQNRE